jgi:hypothetical protein
MQPKLTIRSADSPFVQAVTRWVIDHDDRGKAVPDGCWDLVFITHSGQTNILLTGQTTRAVPLRFDPGDEILTISFKASAFLAFIPSTALLDNGILLHKTGNRFQLGSDHFEIPSFENVEEFTRSLLKKDQLRQDEVVAEVLRDQPPAYSLRSIQRRFLRATGMTHSYFRQIQRARQAAALLQSGKSAVETAVEANYADQPHMSRSLKRILGYTPTEIASLKTL